MKIYISITVLFIVFISSCMKLENGQTMTVEKNCTGDYLNQAGKYYFVCNRGALINFNSGETVSVSYKNLETCNESNGWIVCYMLFPNDGYIKVLSIK